MILSNTNIVERRKTGGGIEGPVSRVRLRRVCRLHDDLFTVDVGVALENIRAAVSQSVNDIPGGFLPAGGWRGGLVLQDRLLAEDNVPRILHNIGGHLVGQVIVQNPIVHALVIAERALKHLVARHGKLRAARRANLLGHIIVAKEHLPSFRVVLLARVARLGRVAERLHLRGTARR